MPAHCPLHLPIDVAFCREQRPFLPASLKNAERERTLGMREDYVDMKCHRVPQPCSWPHVRGHIGHQRTSPPRASLRASGVRGSYPWREDHTPLYTSTTGGGRRSPRLRSPGSSGQHHLSRLLPRRLRLSIIQRTAFNHRTCCLPLQRPLRCSGLATTRARRRYTGPLRPPLLWLFRHALWRRRRMDGAGEWMRLAPRLLPFQWLR